MALGVIGVHCDVHDAEIGDCACTSRCPRAARVLDYGDPEHDAPCVYRIACNADAERCTLPHTQLDASGALRLAWKHAAHDGAASYLACGAGVLA
jgi:hypothetical protein